MSLVEWTLIAGWLGIMLGVLDGAIMGMFFHREGWLGGYGAFKRRMYRLGHISFFGLGFLNIAFYFTASRFDPESWTTNLAALACIGGAMTMPVCCFLVAHRPRCRLWFSVPVISLLIACTITFIKILAL